MQIKENTQLVTFFAPEDVNSAALAFKGFVDRIGDLRIGPCADITSQQPMMDIQQNVLAESVFGWTEPDWRWWSKPFLALDSPLPIICRYENQPFWCNGQGITTRLPNPHLLDIDLTRFEERAFVSAAIVVPVHMAFGKIGAVSFSPRDHSKIDLSREYDEYADELSIYARAFITSYVRAFACVKYIPSDCHLNKREVQCVRWAATGKTDEEIGELIGRTRATVRYHFANAAQKLGAVNRSQAVYKAHQLRSGPIKFVACLSVS